MVVKERGRERGAILKREKGGWGGVGNSKKGEQGSWEEMDRNKTVGRGWKRRHAVKDKDAKEKEQEEGGNKNLSFVSLHFLFTKMKTKKLLFAGLRTPVHSHTR